MMGRVNLTKIDAWGVKAEFEKGLNKVEALTPAGEKRKPKLATNEKFPPISTEDQADVAGTSFATITPEMIVLSSWRDLEAKMRAMIDTIHPPKIGTISVPPLRIEEAARELGLGEDDIQSLMLLRKLRNKVAHTADTKLNWEDATRFMDATDGLASRLRKPPGQ